MNPRQGLLATIWSVELGTRRDSNSFLRLFIIFASVRPGTSVEPRLDTRQPFDHFSVHVLACVAYSRGRLTRRSPMERYVYWPQWALDCQRKDIRKVGQRGLLKRYTSEVPKGLRDWSNRPRLRPCGRHRWLRSRDQRGKATRRLHSVIEDASE